MLMKKSPHNTWVDYYLSNNGGLKWFITKPDNMFTFPTLGDDLRWKAELNSLSPIRSSVINNLVLQKPSPTPTVTNTPTETPTENTNTYIYTDRNPNQYYT